jgi:hypothetical protein
MNKFAIVLILASLTFFACSSPAPIATESSLPTSAPLEILSPTDTASAQPSPTTTESSPQLEIIEWYLWTEEPEVEGNTPYTFVEVLVRNPHDYPVNVYEPAVQFLNSGEIVMRTRDIELYLFADAGWNMILPGETVPGQIIAWPNRFVAELPEWDSFTISADIEAATPIAYTTDLDINMGAFTYKEGANYPAFSAQGTVTNTSGQPLKTILLRVIARDSSGAFVGSGLIGVIGHFFDGNYQNLEPGGTFEVEVLPAYVDPVRSAEALDFEVTGFGIIAQ